MGTLPGLSIWEFPKIRDTFLGVLIIRILLLRALYQGHLFSETPIYFLGAWSLRVGAHSH